MKILFIPSSSLDYLEDIVYHGLISLLGRKSVVDYPPKPNYHCDKKISQEYCWCFFDKKPVDYYKELGEPLVEEFDLVIFGSLRTDVASIVKKFLIAAKKCGTPTIFLDGEDDVFVRGIYYYVNFYFKRECLTDPLNSKSFIFKRSKNLVSQSLAFSLISPVRKVKKYIGVNFFENFLTIPIGLSNFKNINLIPLNFGIIDKKLKLPKEKEFDVAFLATINSAWRLSIYKFLKQYAEKNKINIFIKSGLPWKEYINILGKSKISISVRGGGFDTYRYWEIPYCNSMLLSEYPDIIIKNNFIDNVHASFFRNIQELRDKLDFFLNKEEMVIRLSQEGKKLLMEKHTSVSRAKEILEYTKNL
ncbi:MAG: glycosyltransferase [Candidatus Aenigmatarchaeota archaeon]